MTRLAVSQALSQTKEGNDGARHGENSRKAVRFCSIIRLDKPRGRGIARPQPAADGMIQQNPDGGPVTGGPVARPAAGRTNLLWRAQIVC
jgi:hypothetical protein